MAKNQVSPKPAKAATTQPANEAPVLNVPLEDLRSALFEAESRIAEYAKSAGNPQIATLVQFAELARNFLAEHQSRDSEATLEYLARSLGEMWPEAKRLISQPVTPEISIEELNTYLVSVNDETLELIERSIGEILAARGKPVAPVHPNHPINHSVERVRDALLMQSYFVYSPPATLGDPWAQRALTSMKRQLHQLDPFELMSLSMYLFNAVRTPVLQEQREYVQARAEKALEPASQGDVRKKQAIRKVINAMIEEARK
jgi:hypothetical protein